MTGVLLEVVDHVGMLRSNIAEKYLAKKNKMLGLVVTWPWKKQIYKIIQQVRHTLVYRACDL